MLNSKQYIQCPNCGAEYLIAEIFMSQDILGHPKNINKDSSGKIIYYNGQEPETTEKYCCDYCNKSFEVEIRMQTSSQLDELDFDEEYTSTIYKKCGLFMNEE